MSDKKPKKKMGRPRLGSERGIKCYVSLEPGYLQAFKDEAARNGQRHTVLMREVLMDFIHQRQADQDRRSRFDAMKAHVSVVRSDGDGPDPRGDHSVDVEASDPVP